MVTKKKILARSAFLFGLLTIIPIVTGDIVGMIVGFISVAVLSFWSWDTLN